MAPLVGIGDVVDRERDGERREDLLHQVAVMVGNPHPQRDVPVHERLDGLPQGGRVELAGQINAVRHVVDGRVLPRLMASP